MAWRIHPGGAAARTADMIAWRVSQPEITVAFRALEIFGLMAAAIFIEAPSELSDTLTGPFHSLAIAGS